MNFIKCFIPLLLAGFLLSCSVKKGDITNSDTIGLTLVYSVQVDHLNVGLFTETGCGILKITI